MGSYFIMVIWGGNYQIRFLYVHTAEQKKWPTKVKIYLFNFYLEAVSIWQCTFKSSICGHSRLEWHIHMNTLYGEIQTWMLCNSENKACEGHELLDSSRLANPRLRHAFKFFILNDKRLHKVWNLQLLFSVPWLLQSS